MLLPLLPSQWFDSSTPQSLCPRWPQASVGWLPSSRSPKTVATSTTSLSSCSSSCTPVRAACRLPTAPARDHLCGSVLMRMKLFFDFRSPRRHFARTPRPFPWPVSQVRHQYPSHPRTPNASPGVGAAFGNWNQLFSVQWNCATRQHNTTQYCCARTPLHHLAAMQIRASRLLPFVPFQQAKQILWCWSEEV